MTNGSKSSLAQWRYLKCTRVYGTRHYWRVRRGHSGAGIPLSQRSAEPWNESGFLEEYLAAFQQVVSAPEALPPKFTLAHVITRYRGTRRFQSSAAESKRQNTYMQEQLLRQHRNLDIRKIDVVWLQDFCSRRSSTPKQAVKYIGQFRVILDAAVDAQLLEQNPARDARLGAWLRAQGYLEKNEAGLPTWSREQAEMFLAAHQLGSRAHLWFCLTLYTGARISDVVILGPEHLLYETQAGERKAWLRWLERKGKDGARQQTTMLPVLPPLQVAIDAIPPRIVLLQRAGMQRFREHGVENCNPFLRTRAGNAYTISGLRNSMKDWLRKAHLPAHLGPHGVRKLAATIAAEGGATELQQMAMFGWRDRKMPQHYSRAANSKRLASGAAFALYEYLEEVDVPNEVPNFVKS